MDFMFDWEPEGDRISFEDSDRFEEDSLCSWLSEPESLCNNWRGWRKQNGGTQGAYVSNRENSGSSVQSLVELAAQAVACHIPFEVVEHFYPPIPEQLQLRIAFWSFPENEEDIRLYSCLANGCADEFQKGEHLFKARAVKEALQIGFHLSATVIPPQTLAQAKGAFSVAVVFDRRRITSCNCTCSSSASWCAHVVALCLYRIHLATSVCLRAPVSESLSRLHRDQLQKFAQYLISELPQQILPTAQRLLDELLSSQQTAINTVCGAPDPTAGPSASEQTTWCLDEDTLHENIKKTLIKFCVPAPIVFSDVNYLSSTAPPAAAEWQSLLRPLRGREPEGMWNLLSIIREMFRRNDSNAIPLLEIQTDEVLTCEQILIWWFNTKVSASHNSNTLQSQRGGGGNNASNSSQHAASSLCDEIVTLWRLAALNPALSTIQRDDLIIQLKDWHIKTIDKVRKGRSNMAGGSSTVKKQDIEIFPGFKPAIEACQLSWDDYYIPGVTFVEKGRRQWRFTFSSRLTDGERNKGARPKTQNIAVHKVSLLDAIKPPGGSAGNRKSQDLSAGAAQAAAAIAQTDGACSSSSEGFCENERLDGALNPQDSDSEDGGAVFAHAKSMAVTVQKPAPLVSHGNLKPEQGTSSNKTKEIPNRNGPLQGPNTSQLATDKKVKGDGNESDSSLPEGAAYAPVNKNVVTNVGGAGSSNAVAKPGGEGSEQQQQNLGDEYQLYFYNTSAKLPDPALDKKKKPDQPNYFAGIKKVENKVDLLFARAEALHAHGHTRQACRLTMQLADEMLANPPDLTIEAPPVNVTKGKKKSRQSNTSSFASTTLAKAAFLCNVLLEDVECHHLAFKVGMFGLEMPRPPASSKALEVKLAYQENELASLLKKIPLGTGELNIIRDRAEKLRDGKLKSRGEALLPLTLASFIFESLCLPTISVNGSSSRPPSRSVHVSARQPSDEKLGFEAGVAAIGLKANVSEAEHPLLCEGTRRQRGDLAIAMLVHYKDDQEKLSKIMDKLLDKEVHQLYKAPSLSTYLSSSNRATISMATSSSSSKQQAVVSVTNHKGAAVTASPPSSGAAYDCDEGIGDTPSQHQVSTPSSGGGWHNGSCVQRLEYLDLEQKLSSINLHASSVTQTRTLANRHHSNKDTDSSAVEEDGEGGADYKAWEAKFRCTNFKTNKKHSVGMASIDSSAPETTSSDNSPTLVRRNWAKHQGPGSDSGSSGKSSDSLRSSNSEEKRNVAKGRDDDSPPGLYGMRFAPHLVVDSRSSTPNVKGQRFKGKSRITPTVPNQPSEASAHFMFELAKTLLGKAGGSSATSLFTQPTSTNNHSGPHRALHVCAFQTGLYALGLHNCVSPNWLSRTYSSHVSWITGQAMEIGSAAINILIDTWEGHLTPPEVASLADRASRGCDPNMVRAAAKLALSCLPHAHALNPNEIQRALIQCKEQSQDMLERACLAVESAAKGGGVYPEVLFDVAKRWYELYEESLTHQHHHQGEPAHHHRVLAVDGAELQQALVPLQPGGAALVDNTSPPTVQLIPVQLAAPASGNPRLPPPGHHQAPPPAGAPPQPAAAAVPLPYSLTPPAQFQQPHSYLVSYSYMQPIHNFSHIYSQPHIPLHTHSMHPPYMATYPYQNLAHLQNIHPNAAAAPTLYHPSPAQLRHATPAAVQLYQPAQLAAVVAQNRSQMALQQAPLQMDASAGVAAAVGGQGGTAAVSGGGGVAGSDQLVTAQNSHYLNYLNAVYRVGMLAMETLARRVHDDRPQTKYARNPPYGEDVKWLLTIAMKLGTSYLQQFCASAVNAVVSPFVLHDIAIEAAHYLSRNNPTPTQVSGNLRSPILNSLVQKCLQMFIQCSHQRMHHITQAEYDEFVGIVCSARNAFCMTPGGLVQFNELLQSLRRAKSCKKDLWLRIMNGLATTGTNI